MVNYWKNAIFYIIWDKNKKSCKVKSWMENNHPFRINCFPGSLPSLSYLHMWIFDLHLCPCGHRKWRESSLWPLLTNSATKANLEGKMTIRAVEQRNSSGFQTPVHVLWKGPRWLIHPSACSVKRAVKLRAKNISKNACRFPWPIYVRNFLQTRPIRKKRRKGAGCVFH